jgi:parvulin-like peptidyl-prolyl isomerase
MFRVPGPQAVYDQAREQTRFGITYLELNPSNFVKSPDDKQIWAYYNGHKSQFQKPERRTLRYALFSLKVGPEDSAAAKAQIDDIYGSIRGLDDFDYQTDRENDSLGLWFRSDSLDTIVRAAVANLPRDSLTHPVLGKEGWQIIQLTDRNKDSVRLRTITTPIEVTASTFSATNEKIGNLTERAKEENFDSVAKELGVEVRDAPVLEKGKDYGFDPEISASVEVWARRAKVGDVSQAYRNSREEVYVFHLTAVQRGLATVMDSFEVRNKVTSTITMDKAKPMMEARARTILRDLKAGKTMEDIAKSDSLVRLQNRPATTLAGYNWIGPEFAGTLYGLKAGRTSDLVRTERGMYVIRCDTRDDASPAPNPFWAQSKYNSVLQKVRESVQKPPRVIDWRNPFNQ